MFELILNILINEIYLVLKLISVRCNEERMQPMRNILIVII